MTLRDRLNRHIVGIIRRKRLEGGWTNAEISEWAKIPLGSYSNIEAGRYRLNLLHLLRLQIAMGLDIWTVWPVDRMRQQQVTDGALKAVLKAAEERLPEPLTIQDIVAAAAYVCDVWPDEMRSPSRSRRLAKARAVAAALARKTPELNISRMALHFGRDHSVLSRSIKWQEVNYPEEFQTLISRAEKLLRLV